MQLYPDGFHRHRLFFYLLGLAGHEQDQEEERSANYPRFERSILHLIQTNSLGMPRHKAVASIWLSSDTCELCLLSSFAYLRFICLAPLLFPVPPWRSRMT